MSRDISFLIAFGCSVALVACGGRESVLGPQAPVGVSKPEAAGALRASGASAVAAALTVVDGETDQPISGAQVTVAGRPFTTDAAGQFSAPDPVLADAQVEINANGYLKRETLARSDRRFTLWPDKSGFDAAFTREMVYFSGFTPDAKLTRPNRGFFVAFSPDFDSEGQAAGRDAAALITAATGGQIPFEVGAAPAGAPVITLRINSGAGFFSQNPGAAAFAEVPFLGNVIGGPNGAINFRDASFTRIRALIAHELGHHFGLGHPSAIAGLMSASVDAGRGDYSSAEKLAMRLMLARRPGNSFPDNDRAVVGAARGRGVLVFGCELSR